MFGADDRNKVTQAKSWIVHNSGEISILVARGADQYIYGHAHRLFVDGRLHLVSFILFYWESREFATNFMPS